jgi:hypothetical protein
MMLGGRFGVCRLGIGLMSRMGSGLGLCGDDCVCERQREGHLALELLPYAMCILYA